MTFQIPSKDKLADDITDFIFKRDYQHITNHCDSFYGGEPIRPSTHEHTILHDLVRGDVDFYYAVTDIDKTNLNEFIDKLKTSYSTNNILLQLIQYNKFNSYQCFLEKYKKEPDSSHALAAIYNNHMHFLEYCMEHGVAPDIKMLEAAIVKENIPLQHQLVDMGVDSKNLQMGDMFNVTYIQKYQASLELYCTLDHTLTHRADTRKKKI